MRIKEIVFLCTPFILSSGLACAQTITGSITGVVTDPTGAVIPDAKVTAINSSTGVTNTATTNGDGIYYLRFLQIGQYKITIEAAGFKGLSTQPFTLEVDQVAKIDGKLETGDASESVTVTDELQPILDTDNSTLTTTFTANTLQNVPLNGRNFSSITQFLPGAVDTSPAGMSGVNAIERATGPDGQVSVNGNRNQSNNYLLDGIEINETINNTIGYNPSPDAIENLTAITSNAGAEYGNVNGGDIIAVLKSGTNHFHGSAFAFLENYNLDANTWANKFAKVPRQPFTQTIFGGTFGGPVLKNKLFFFVDYSANRYQMGGSQAASVIPAAFRKGDFSSLPVQLTHFVPGQGQVAYPNNQVPITNPVAQYLFAHPEFYPLPNQTPTDGIAQNNYIGSYRNTVRNDQGDVKIDYTLGPRDTIMGRYSQGIASDATPQTPLAITFPPVNDYPFKGIALNWIHTFSPTIVNEARAGWSRVRWDQGIPQDTTGAFGMSGNSIVGINAPQPYPGFTLQDFGAIGAGSNQTYLTGVGTFGGGSSLIDNTFSYGDTLTLQLNKHSIKAGVEILRYQQNDFYPGNDGVMGRMQYSSAFTGDTMSDFVTDNIWYAGISANVGRSGQRQYRDAAFVQDDWKITSNLTLNLGLRYEYDQPIYEVNNKQGNVDLATGAYYTAGQAGAGAIFGDSRALYHPTYTNFQPRVGFSYQPLPRLVVRGGYGITNYLEGTGSNLRLNFNPPFHPVYSYTAVAASATSAGTPLTVQNAIPSNVTGSLISNTYRAWGNIKPALIQEFTLSTEYELDNKTSVVIGYVGQTGQHLIDPRAGNQLTAPGTVAPYANLVGQTGSVVITESEAMSNYNAAQLQMRRRQSKGLEFQINYTFAKAMTNNPGFFGAPNTSNASPYWQDAYNGHADYGPSGTDTRHSLSATAVYQLPFGRGQMFGGNSNWIVNEAIGGWKITGTAIAFSGLPVTINGPDTTSVNNKASRANHYQNLKITNRTLSNWFGTGSTVYHPIQSSTTVNGVTTVTTVNGCATAQAQSLGCAYGPTIGEQFGSAAVGTERAPGFEQLDFSAGKEFHIYNEQALEFRSDFFNAFNIASYGNPDNGITDSNFGQITNVRGIPRTIQFSLHYHF
ncbi:TonB-dependent receptor [Edaphobacter modestus]|uniref:TonB-dependent receptor-like protein n=1 Tax=Edaphobacter modestus TaxID=388466 RepID=A0A4Q7YVJ0_9BACT|nr:TonB-dependent receptor [Edaphobacter modestus]RZU41902.1 TonB-dependent receptor-like protein [Edaphobacter modestus]